MLKLFSRKDKPVLGQRLLEYHFNAAPIGIASVFEDGTIDMHNKAFALIFKRQEFNGAGTSIFDYLQPEDHEHVKYALSYAKAEPDASPLEVKLTHHWAGACDLYIGRADKQDGSKRYVIHCLDVTERKALERQFSQSQKMQALGQMAGGVAHDFNNLLTAIGGYADMLLGRFTPEDDAHQEVSQIKTNTDRAARIVKQLLAYSRQQKLKPEVIDVQACIEDAGQLFKRLIREDISFSLSFLDTHLWHVEVDKTELVQTLMNLVVNAVDAMPERGQIDIAVANKPFAYIAHNNQGFMPEADYVGITVRDTGHGIPDDIRRRIFEPFFTTKDIGKGTGLGLAQVYGFVKQTGGFIFCDSIVGEGTTFTIYLPRHYGKVKASTSDIKVDVTKGSGLILLVEDEDTVRGFGRLALTKQGYTVVEATNGQAALDVLAGGVTPDLLITDVMMPEMDGVTLIRRVRESHPALKIICMSGYAEEAMREKLNDFKDVNFLAKPFSLQQLVLSVKNALAV